MQGSQAAVDPNLPSRLDIITNYASARLWRCDPQTLAPTRQSLQAGTCSADHSLIRADLSNTLRWEEARRQQIWLQLTPPTALITPKRAASQHGSMRRSEEPRGSRQPADEASRCGRSEEESLVLARRGCFVFVGNGSSRGWMRRRPTIGTISHPKDEWNLYGGIQCFAVEMRGCRGWPCLPNNTPPRDPFKICSIPCRVTHHEMKTNKYTQIDYEITKIIHI